MDNRHSERRPGNLGQDYKGILARGLTELSTSCVLLVMSPPKNLQIFSLAKLHLIARVINLNL